MWRLTRYRYQGSSKPERVRVLAFERVVLLTPANHPQVKEIVQQPGFVELQDIAGVVR